MNQSIEFIDKETLKKAAELILADENYSSNKLKKWRCNYSLSVNGGHHIPLITLIEKSAKLKEIPFNSENFKGTQSDLDIVEERTGYTLKHELGKSSLSKNRFKNFINQMESSISTTDIKDKFNITNKSPTGKWIWLSDKYNIIGNQDVHYEIINHLGEELSIELHFENTYKKNRYIFEKELRKELPPELLWFPWRGYKTNSIRAAGNIHIDDPLLFKKIFEKLNYFEESGISDKVRAICSKRFPQNSNSIKKTNMSDNNNSHPLNQILYGPPGTGKTYHTIDLTAKILGFDTGNHDKNLAEFNNKLGENIEFVTFHQSFAYEDFIEGIKPETTADNQVIYKIKSGIFKQISDRAKSAQLKKEPDSPAREFERVFEQLVNSFEESENDEIEIPMKRVTFHVTGIDDNYIKFRKASGGTSHDLNMGKLRKIYTGEVKEGTGIWIYYIALVDYLKSNAPTLPAIVETEKDEKFVLIIDEINRGNVSSVFGELITLIEPDKRAQGTHPLKLQLPYSKSQFSVPSNLYIIGTMNTADRSVEALDTALRRRFHFTEVPPNPDLLEEVDNYDLSEILETINKRIEILLDRDHLIGHSYFLKVEDEQDLLSAFKDRIIPLLQEYFYSDYAKIELVLGEKFCTGEKVQNQKTVFAKTATKGIIEENDFSDRVIYKFPIYTDTDFDLRVAITALLNISA